MAVFLLINGALKVGFLLHPFDRFNLFNHDRLWYAVKAVEVMPAHPDIFLLGSSVVEKLLDDGEATYLNKTINAVTHKRCIHLEDALRREMKKPILSASFAVGGLHFSDASIAVSTLLTGAKTPRCIIYGIAPRDAMNNLLASPVTTETYRFMDKLADLSDVAYLARPTTKERCDYLFTSTLKKILPLYDYRDELALSYRRLLRNRCFEPLLNKLGENDGMEGAMPGIARATHAPHLRLMSPNLGSAQLASVAGVPFTLADKIQLGLLPEEADDYQPVMPFDPAHPPLSENKMSYLFGYRPFRFNVYKNQLAFLARLLRIAKERGIFVILVNMPLREDNLQAMDPGFYSLYQKDMRSIAIKYGDGYINMMDAGNFSSSDFIDQVHLNGRGACKFIDLLAPQLAGYL